MSEKHVLDCLYLSDMLLQLILAVTLFVMLLRGMCSVKLTSCKLLNEHKKITAFESSTIKTVDLTVSVSYQLRELVPLL